MMRITAAAVAILMLLEGCTAMSRHRHDAQAATVVTSQTTLYVARRGWHIDIGFAVSDLAPPLGELTADFPAAHYVFFGFGDRHYLASRNKNFPSMLAALWPGAGVVLATALTTTPEQAFGAGHVMRFIISAPQAKEAQRFIWNSMSKDNGKVSVYAQGPYEGSLYYSAVPSYSAVHTCNTWAAQDLKVAGLPIHSAGVVFAAQLWWQLRRVAATYAATIDTVPVAHQVQSQHEGPHAAARRQPLARA